MPGSSLGPRASRPPRARSASNMPRLERADARSAGGTPAVPVIGVICGLFCLFKGRDNRNEVVNEALCILLQQLLDPLQLLRTYNQSRVVKFLNAIDDLRIVVR